MRLLNPSRLDLHTPFCIPLGFMKTEKYPNVRKDKLCNATDYAVYIHNAVIIRILSVISLVFIRFIT